MITTFIRRCPKSMLIRGDKIYASTGCMYPSPLRSSWLYNSTGWFMPRVWLSRDKFYARHRCITVAVRWNFMDYVALVAARSIVQVRSMRSPSRKPLDLNKKLVTRLHLCIADFSFEHIHRKDVLQSRNIYITNL